MYDRPTDPLLELQGKMLMLGNVLSALCLAWILVVGLVLSAELTPDELEHHRAPIIQDRVGHCEGSFNQRFDCTQSVLLDGERVGARNVLLRLGVTVILPMVAWAVWSSVMRRTRALLRWAYEQALIDGRLFHPPGA